ncbi:MAG: GlsB/YeaQ/YmgE family stress response membrane protein [Candidatus Sericytochromatia bacterium]
MPIVLVIVLALLVVAFLTGPILGLVWTLLIGFLAGAIAKFLMPGRDGGGFLMTSLLGIAGAFTASILGRLLGIYQPGQAAGFLAAIVGAVILLAVYRMVQGRSAVHV